MRRFLQRIPSSVARNLRHSRHSNTNPRVVVVPSLNRITSRPVFFSSESDPAHGSKPDELISKEEFKRKIQNFLEDEDEGEEALTDLFEALLKRKLSGGHDDEIMEEVRKYPVLNNIAEKHDDPDSDVESEGLRDGASSFDSDIESDAPKADRSSHSDSDSD